MKQTADLESLANHARRLRDEKPELFEYLANREAELVSALLEVASTIPRPDDLPKLHLGLPDLVETRRCRTIGEDLNQVFEELDLDLPPQLEESRRRARWLCENGIRLKKGSLRELAVG